MSHKKGGATTSQTGRRATTKRKGTNSREVNGSSGWEGGYQHEEAEVHVPVHSETYLLGRPRWTPTATARVPVAGAPDHRALVGIWGGDSLFDRMALQRGLTASAIN